MARNPVRRAALLLAALAVLGRGAAARAQNAGAVLDTHSTLTATTPVSEVLRPGAHFRVHEVRLVAGQTYQIDLRSAAFDAYLFLLDADFGQLKSDDDGSGNRDARITFTPRTTGTYHVMATTCFAGRTGAYHVTVRRLPRL